MCLVKKKNFYVWPAWTYILGEIGVKTRRRGVIDEAMAQQDDQHTEKPARVHHHDIFCRIHPPQRSEIILRREAV